MRIKPRLAPPAGGRPQFSRLVIQHPCYDNFNTLLKLPVLDEGNTIDYGTALTTCGIVCDNSYGTGWFARSRDGSSICTPGTPLESDKYPVCPSWDHWCPPSNEHSLPSGFASFQIPDAPPYLGNGGFMDDLQRRDVSCRVTGVYDGCEQAHLVPASDQDWWYKNVAGTSGFEIESALNGIFLRSDLHRLFDAGAWVPMVKENRMVVHVLRDSTVSKQFIEIFHNREMQELIGIDKQCLFARIAYSTFSLLFDFLASRRLANDNTLFKFGDDIAEWSPDACKKWFKAKSRSRNPSPTKRLRVDRDGGDGDQDTVWCTYGPNVAVDKGKCLTENERPDNTDRSRSSASDGSYDEEENLPRGRKRRRSFDDRSFPPIFNSLPRCEGSALISKYEQGFGARR
ncbi:hypothetical protein BDY21DRAFT_354436 [Lineolata rhizophorae]|uniref:HNH nuclease domain-containing protein n=1 Tax=Lineolata rhizophorae TaxID=578093 RepID=A0A6A6NR57_9PEZI|nr:hypothetical protein BDY21DRAFT_354436 [Lineolata rhizophorae]